MYTSCGRNVAAALGLGRPRPPTSRHSILVYLAHDTCSFRIPARVTAAAAAARRSTVACGGRTGGGLAATHGRETSSCRGRRLFVLPPRHPPPYKTTCRAGRFYNDNIFIHTYVLYTTYYNNTLLHSYRVVVVVVVVLFTRARGY